MGRVIARGWPGERPLFSCRGLDENGFVQTDTAGFVVDPDNVDIHCDYLGEFDVGGAPGEYREGEKPRSHFIPPNATVQLAFQGASAITDGSKEVDPKSMTDWSPDPGVANGLQFIRYRVTFDLTADGDESAFSNELPRAAVQAVKVRAKF